MRRPSLRTSLASFLVVALAAPLFVAVAPSSVVHAQTAAAGSASASGSATPATEDDNRQKAIEHFNRGVELMQNESWDASYAEFSASISLLPTKNARKNAAVCLRQLQRFDEALAMYEALLRDFGAKLTPDEQAIVKKSMEDLRALTGYIVVRSTIDGATVVIDGKDRGKTPLPAPILVSAGTRVVRVSKEGYLPYEAKELVAGKTTVTVDAALEALARSGRIKVTEATGKVLDVVIDGAVVGKTPYEGQVAPGTHSVLLKGEGKLGTQPAAANVVVDQTFVLRLDAEELKGEARIEPEPAGASVVLDGVAVGQGTWEGMLRLGTHKVDVSAEGYFGTTKTFEATEGKKTELKVSLDRDDNSSFWSKGRRYAFNVAAFGGAGFGKSLGGVYESSCGNSADCYSHSSPLLFLGGVRAGYEVAPGLSIELDLGYMFAKMALSRRTTLLGDSTIPVPVDITDTVRVSGPFIGIGASYAFLRKPISLTGALTGGAILAKIRDLRTGTVTVDVDPSRALFDGGDSTTKALPFVLPEVRVAYPVTDQLSVGLSFAALIVVADVRPKVQQSPVPIKAVDGNANPRYQGAPVGNLPHSPTDSAVGTFLLPEATLFVRMAF